MYVVNVDGEKVRLGEQQRGILAFYVKWRDEWGKPQSIYGGAFLTGRSKYGNFRGAWGSEHIPVLWARNEMFHRPIREPYRLRNMTRVVITPSGKASFSRSLRQLEAKRLIECKNSITGKQNYATHYKITKKGEKVLEQVNFSNISQKLTCQTGGGSEVVGYKWLVRFKGMPEPIICPAFWELKWAYGCVHNCSYCYLLGTLRGKRLIPWKTYLERKKVLERELPAFFEEHEEPCILNSGEIADSLMFERNPLKHPFIPWVTELFKTQRGHKHLILTKGTDIENLLESEGQEVTIYSASINPEEMWCHEKGTPPPTERIEAAKRVQEAGYEARIRIDFPFGDLSKLIDDVYASFKPSRVTLGTPRINNFGLWKYEFWQNWKSKMKHIGGGKWRYDREESELIYTQLIDLIRGHDPKVPIALCKETREMWKRVGLNPNKCECNCQW